MRLAFSLRLICFCSFPTLWLVARTSRRTLLCSSVRAGRLGTFVLWTRSTEKVSESDLPTSIEAERSMAALEGTCLSELLSMVTAEMWPIMSAVCFSSSPIGLGVDEETCKGYLTTFTSANTALYISQGADMESLQVQSPSIGLQVCFLDFPRIHFTFKTPRHTARQADPGSFTICIV